MSTKKICIEVERMDSLNKRIEVLKAIERIIEDTKTNVEYYAKDAETYAEQGLESYAEKQYVVAKSYDYVLNIIEKIASEI